MLQNELQNWKEACRKQVENRLNTLVEVADHLEGSPPLEGGLRTGKSGMYRMWINIQLGRI